MAVLVETREFVISSGTGNITFGGFGFTPKACIFILMPCQTDNVDSDAVSAGSGCGMGMCDGTRQWAWYSGSEDGVVAGADVGRRSTTSGCIMRSDEQASQVLLGKASFVSFPANGVQVNRLTAFTVPVGPRVRIIAFGGADLTAYGDIFDPNNTQDGTTATTAPGFEPDLIIAGMVGHHEDVDGATGNDDDACSIGWAVNPDRQASNNQFCIGFHTVDGGSAQVNNMSFHNNRCCVSREGDAADAGIEITAWSSTGFTATTRDAAAGTLDRFFYLALHLGGGSAQVYSVNLDTPTGTGNQSDASVGFTPLFLFGIMISDNRTVNTWDGTATENSSIGIGMTDGTRDLSLTRYGDDAATTTNCRSRVRNSQFFSTDNEVGATEVEANFISFQSTGWTLNFGTVTTAELRRAAYLVIGDLLLVREQEGFRWRNDDGSESAATWRENQDVNEPSIGTAENIRLRMLLNMTGDVPSEQYELEYKETADPDAEYRIIPLT